MTGSSVKLCIVAIVAMLSLLAADSAGTHHVLGRPAYSLNEDPNAPPAVRGETETGGFIVTYMVFPAFPRPGEPGRGNFYIKSQDGGTLFQGKVTFTIRADSWLSWLGFGGRDTDLGTQRIDDSVFRQGFVFPDEGTYILAAKFEADGMPHRVEFPLRIGMPMPMEYVFGGVLALLVGFVVFQRRRSMTGKLRGQHADSGKP